MGGSFATTLPADPGGLTGSRCSSYETNSCLDKGMLRGSWLSAGGRTNWMEPEPFRAFEKKKIAIQNRRVTEEVVIKERGKEAGE